MAARAQVAAGAAATRAHAGDVFVQDDRLAKQAAAVGHAPVVRAARRAALGRRHVLDDGTVVVDDVRAVEHVAVDAPEIRKRARDQAVRVVELDAVLQHLHVGRLAQRCDTQGDVHE